MIFWNLLHPLNIFLTPPPSIFYNPPLTRKGLLTYAYNYSFKLTRLFNWVRILAEEKPRLREHKAPSLHAVTMLKSTSYRPVATIWAGGLGTDIDSIIVNASGSKMYIEDDSVPKTKQLTPVSSAKDFFKVVMHVTTVCLFRGKPPWRSTKAYQKVNICTLVHQKFTKWKVKAAPFNSWGVVRMNLRFKINITFMHQEKWLQSHQNRQNPTDAILNHWNVRTSIFSHWKQSWFCILYKCTPFASHI